MKRLIVLTFAALGWVFYVMSGGPDFAPPGERAPVPEQVAEAPKPAPAPLVAPKAEELVTKTVLQPATPVVPKVVPEPEPVTTEESIALLAQAASSLNSGASLFGTQTTGLTLASLEQGAAGLQQITPTELEPAETPVAAEPVKDIREVSGTRVNMRDGPGTIYPIIAKVTIGQKVEVLHDPGTGWLRLRVLPERHVGWISASLIRKIND